MKYGTRLFDKLKIQSFFTSPLFGISNLTAKNAFEILKIAEIVKSD